MVLFSGEIVDYHQVSMATIEEKQKPKTFTDGMRLRFCDVLEKAGAVLNAMGLTPNMVTTIGLIGNMAAGVLLALGYITWGGIVALFVVPLDALDGAVARYSGSVTPYGAFLDSVTDRYSEIFLFGGLLVYYFGQDNLLAIGLVFAALCGSLMVSYVKARAEANHFDANVGLLTRLERMLILIPSLVFNLPMVALWIIAVLANVTALQRIFYVYGQYRASKGK